MKKNFIFTLGTNIFTMISGLLVYKLATVIFGVQGFAEYSLGKRIISFFRPIFLLGLGVGITRYVSVSLKETDKIKNIVIGSILIVSFNSLILLIIFELFKKEIAHILFNSYDYTFLILPLALTILGLLWHTLIYSYYRGKFEIKKANIIQLINLGIIPVIIFLFSKNLAQLFILNGFFILIVSFVIISYILINEKLYKLNSKRSIFQDIKQLFLYSIGRVPGDIGLAALFSLIPIFVTHLSSVRNGGIVAFGISLLNLIASFFATIGIVMLPKIGILYSEKNYKLIIKYTYKIFKISILLPALGVIIFLIFGDEILKMYLGENIASQSGIIKIVFLGTIPYVIYVSLRSVIDAIFEKPYNTVNVLISVLLLLILSFFIYLLKKDYLYIIYSFLFSLCLLVGLTLLKIFTIKCKFYGH